MLLAELGHCMQRIENRVKTTNGTAAVSTPWISWTKVGHWRKLRRLRKSASVGARCESEELLKCWLARCIVESAIRLFFVCKYVQESGTGIRLLSRENGRGALNCALRSFYSFCMKIIPVWVMLFRVTFHPPKGLNLFRRIG